MDSDRERGIYGKYSVERTHDPNGKHENCNYFVLDLIHDSYGRSALYTYANLCEQEFPLLARDIRSLLTLTSKVHEEEMQKKWRGNG